MKKKQVEIGLGDRVKDKISGFTGIATADTKYLNGCDRIIVSPEELHEGSPVEDRYFDVTQLEVVKKGVVKPPVLPAEKAEKDTGGPRGSSAPSRSKVK